MGFAHRDRLMQELAKAVREIQKPNPGTPLNEIQVDFMVDGEGRLGTTFARALEILSMDEAVMYESHGSSALVDISGADSLCVTTRSGFLADTIKKRGIIEHVHNAHVEYIKAFNLVGGDTSDIEEQLDETEVALYGHADIEFVECSQCEGDVLAEDVHYYEDPGTGRQVPVGPECWDERLRS